MNIDKIKEKYRIQMYYQGLNGRLMKIADDIVKIEASNELHAHRFGEKGAGEVPEQEWIEHLYRHILLGKLKKEAAEIRLITETPITQNAEP